MTLQITQKTKNSTWVKCKITQDLQVSLMNTTAMNPWWTSKHQGCQNSGGAWKSRWPSWAPVPNKPSFCGCKATPTNQHQVVFVRSGPCRGFICNHPWLAGLKTVVLKGGVGVRGGGSLGVAVTEGFSWSANQPHSLSLIKQRWGNFWMKGSSAYGLSSAWTGHPEMNWTACSFKTWPTFYGPPPGPLPYPAFQWCQCFCHKSKTSQPRFRWQEEFEFFSCFYFVYRIALTHRFGCRLKLVHEHVFHDKTDRKQCVRKNSTHTTSSD